MKNWVTKAMDFLKASLEPPRHELNELDWKAGLSVAAFEGAAEEALDWNPFRLPKCYPPA